jgi:hypothetical protein
VQPGGAARRAGSARRPAGWNALPLTAKGAVIETLMVVTILPIGKGMRFDPNQVQIEWRT